MYQVLYRKYRPKVFKDVYGQDHVTSTLKNEIKNGRIAHAYLFTGSRGTGKTSCAKILAKAVNCLNLQDGEPCNECEVCKGIDNGSIYDVVEIDAASNNGVDNIRELREDVKYTPSKGKYRVYIIDEVHMLSPGAFNALLKTLEEPPEHVIFILATTDVQKLPATILSRCQRFDFKRIQPETMALRLNEVSEKEGFELDGDAALLIARIADGALRDGLSILDQCAGRDKHITSGLVSNVAGLAGRESLYKLSDCVSSHDSNNAVNIIADLYEDSYDMERLCVEMINHYRNFLIVKTAKKSRGLIICTDDEYEMIKTSASKYTLEGVIHALDVFQEALVKIKSGAAARIETEMAFVKLCEPKLDADVSSLLDRISVLERKVKNGVAPVHIAESTSDVSYTKSDLQPDDFDDVPDAAEVVPPVIDEDEPIPESEKAEQASDSDKNNLSIPQNNKAEDFEKVKPKGPTKVQQQAQAQTEFTRWGEFIDELKRLDITLFGLLSDARGYIKGNVFFIDSPNPAIKDFIQKNNCSKTIKQALYDITGNKYKIGIYKHRQAPVNTDPLDELINKAIDKNINVDIK